MKGAVKGSFFLYILLNINKTDIIFITKYLKSVFEGNVYGFVFKKA